MGVGGPLLLKRHSPARFGRGGEGSLAPGCGVWRLKDVFRTDKTAMGTTVAATRSERRYGWCQPGPVVVSRQGFRRKLKQCEAGHSCRNADVSWLFFFLDICWNSRDARSSKRDFILTVFCVLQGFLFYYRADLPCTFIWTVSLINPAATESAWFSRWNMTLSFLPPSPALNCDIL